MRITKKAAALQPRKTRPNETDADSLADATAGRNSECAALTVYQPPVEGIRDGGEIDQEQARALFDAFRAAENDLQKYVNKFSEYSRERYLLMSRYRGQLKRWLNSWRREASKHPSNPEWHELIRVQPNVTDERDRARETLEELT